MRHRQPPETEIYYPESDDQPMAETKLHFDAMVELYQRLTFRYRDRPEVFVGSNLLVYPEKGNPRVSFAPDLIVVLQGPAVPVRVLKLWELAQPPDFILELSSTSTFRHDLGKKRELYESLGIRSYFLFDPTYESLRPPLQGWELKASDGRFVHVEPDQEGRYLCTALEMHLQLVDDRLQLFDATSGLPLWTHSESLQARIAELEAELRRKQD